MYVWGPNPGICTSVGGVMGSVSAVWRYLDKNDNILRVEYSKIL